MFWESATLNGRTAIKYYRRLMELAMVMFEWQNLPDSIDERFMEMVLFSEGKAVFFKDDVLGYLCLRCAVNGPLNEYQIPMNRRAYASNGYSQKLNKDNSVIIYNNYLHTNSMMEMTLYANDLANLEDTIRVNANAQKTPIIISCDEKDKLALEQLYMKYQGNQPFIFGDKRLTPEALKVINTSAPFICDDLYVLKTQTWNEALTYLGISNVNVQKRERMITDEIQRNNAGTIASRYSRLLERQNACKKINEMFGLNIDCVYRKDIPFKYDGLEEATTNDFSNLEVDKNE